MPRKTFPLGVRWGLSMAEETPKTVKVQFYDVRTRKAVGPVIELPTGTGYYVLMLDGDSAKATFVDMRGQDVDAQLAKGNNADL